MISKLTMLAAVVAANDIEETFEADTELHSHILKRDILFNNLIHKGWCNHGGA